jgi:hypothetical protein
MTNVRAKFSNVGSVCLQDGMQKVRGSNPLSSTEEVFTLR